MTKQNIGLGFVFLTLLFGWVREGFKSSDAEAFAAERDAVAEIALDSAASYPEQLNDTLAAIETSRVAYEDSLLVWAQRTSEANARAQAAILGARRASTDLAVTLDATQTALLRELEAQHRIEVIEIREIGREEGRIEVRMILEPQITRLTAGLALSQAETAEVRTALEATQAAEDALRSEVRHQKRVGLLWKVAAGAGAACAVICR